MKKRIFSLLLSLCIVLPLCPITTALASTDFVQLIPTSGDTTIKIPNGYCLKNIYAISATEYSGGDDYAGGSQQVDHGDQ